MFYFLCLFLSIFTVFAAENPTAFNHITLKESSLKRTIRYDDLTTLFLNSNQENIPDTKIKKLNPYELFEEHVDIKKIPYQGWKIYVSANPNKIDLIRNKVTHPLIQQKINYKIIKNVDAYLALNTNPEEKGKFITIYPRNEEEALFIAQDINTILDCLDESYFIPINVCIPLGQSGGLWTRYGQFHGTWPTKAGKILHVSKKDQFLTCTNQDELLKWIRLNNVFIPDDRTIPFPHFVDLSWLPFKTLSYIFPHASTFPNSTIDFSNDF